MSIYGNQSRHWDGVGRRFLFDAFLVALSFYAASVLRFEQWWPAKLGLYLPSIAGAALLLPVSNYILGLYTDESLHYSAFHRFALLAVSFSLMLGFALAWGSIHFSARIGRGVMAGAASLSAVVVWAHHEWLRRRAVGTPMRLAALVISGDDAEEACRLAAFDKPHTVFAGVVLGHDTDENLVCGLSVLGRSDILRDGRAFELLDGLVVRTTHAMMPEVATVLRALRYQGLHVLTLMDAFEDTYQMAPLDLIDGGWLLQASSKPAMIYIRKLKRAFDIIVSLVLLVALGPVCLMAMLMIRLSSRGPVLFRQVRSGRFGREFVLLKLRSMRVDAEALGPQWSNSNDKRITWWGSFLRKYRIDEIPQLINILRGDMSFVGPRPERPEFVGELEAAIPHYRERLNLQPGLTGWAQVCFPYGATVEDARRKLQYDLYYLKHMGLSLDLFILLDTVRTILRGTTYSQAPAEPAAVCVTIRSASAGHLEGIR